MEIEHSYYCSDWRVICLWVFGVLLCCFIAGYCSTHTPRSGTQYSIEICKSVAEMGTKRLDNLINSVGVKTTEEIIRTKCIVPNSYMAKSLVKRNVLNIDTALNIAEKEKNQNIVDFLVEMKKRRSIKSL